MKRRRPMLTKRVAEGLAVIDEHPDVLQYLDGALEEHEGLVSLLAPNDIEAARAARVYMQALSKWYLEKLNL